MSDTDTTNAAHLRADGLVKTYDSGADTIHVLSGVAISLDRGDSVAIVGPSGSGKSTILNILGSLDRPDAGTVHLGETDVTALDDTGLAGYRRDRVGFVFQEPHLLPQCTILENVLIPTLTRRDPDAPKRALCVLERVGLADRARAFPDQLSGGQRQRVAIARALINKPELLLCDEPTGNLDRDTGTQVVDLFLELHREANSILVVVTHDVTMAARMQRVLTLENGVLTNHTGN